MPNIADEVNNRKRTEDVSKVRRDWNEEKTDKLTEKEREEMERLSKKYLMKP